jgi:hypothetical protein
LANNVATTPYSFTSKMASSFHNTSGSTPASGAITIVSVTWVSPAAVGDEVTITDGSGKTLLHLVASKEDVSNGEVNSALQVSNSTVKDFQVVSLSSGTLYINTNSVAASAGVAGGTVTTKGTAVAAGTAQAQTALSVPGITANSAIAWSIATPLPATWQTGIQVVPVVANDTVTIYLVNPTASSITPVAVQINVRVIN